MNWYFLTIIIFLLNIPFGYWRAKTKKLSVEWFVAIHTAVILVVILRIWGGVGFDWLKLPVYMLFFFLGQAVGVRINNWFGKHTGMDTTKFLFLDLYHWLLPVKDN